MLRLLHKQNRALGTLDSVVLALGRILESPGRLFHLHPANGSAGNKSLQMGPGHR